MHFYTEPYSLFMWLHLNFISLAVMRSNSAPSASSSTNSKKNKKLNIDHSDSIQCAAKSLHNNHNKPEMNETEIEKQKSNESKYI